MNTSKPVRVKGWIADSYVLEPFPSVIQGMEEKFVLKIHPEEGSYIFDQIEERVTQKKLEAFEHRFEDPLLSEMEYTNHYQDRLFDGAKIVFETLRKPSLTGNLKRVQSDEELIGKFVEAVGHIQILKGGNAFLSVHLIDEAARSYEDLDPFK